jgi:hypothetical protein
LVEKSLRKVLETCLKWFESPSKNPTGSRNEIFELNENHRIAFNPVIGPVRNSPLKRIHPLRQSDSEWLLHWLIDWLGDVSTNWQGCSSRSLSSGHVATFWSLFNVTSCPEVIRNQIFDTILQFWLSLLRMNHARSSLICRILRSMVFRWCIRNCANYCWNHSWDRIYRHRDVTRCHLISGWRKAFAFTASSLRRV